jgi:eukaryotic-like serine/threonine-protein kinase
MLAQKPLANAPAATVLDCLRLGQTVKSQANLLRLNGQLSQAKSVYELAIAALERAHAAEPKHPEVRNDLAIATDARRWIDREPGDVKGAERDYRPALAMLDTLLADFPSSPRYRESLARVCNSLALIEQSTGRLNDAVTHFRRELQLVDRLVLDFPDRPGHKRELVRTLMNLGNVLRDLGRPKEAEPALVRAVELISGIAAANPRDVQARLDLSRCDNNLGDLLRAKGEIQQALTSFGKARSVGEKLVHEFPDKPRYHEELTGMLTNVAVALESIDPAKAEATHQIKRGRLSRAARQPPARTGLDRPHAMFLREEIDTNPKLAAPIKADADIKRLVSRPEFRQIIQALVDLGR